MTSQDVLPTKPKEINLYELVKGLKRRWQFVLSGVVVGCTIAISHTHLTGSLWKGSFEIIVESQGNSTDSLSSLVANIPLASGLVGGGGTNSNQLLTQVKILESSSVLKPVFKKVLSQRASRGENISNLNFEDWLKKNLSISLTKGTSVLTVEYVDNDKNLILSVLQDISNTYQTYSRQARSESLKNGLEYAGKQVNTYREQSNASFRALNAFAIKYGISDSNRSSGQSNIDVSQLLKQHSSANRSAIQVAGPNTSSTFSSNGNPLIELAKLNQELIQKEQIFTSKDPSIIKLRRDRDALLRYIESSAAGVISYSGKKGLSKTEAQSILQQYKELERKAARDQTTLDSMESALLSLQLESARSTKPWELISTPTLRNKPIAPRPMRDILIGVFSGLLLGSIAGLLVDRLSETIFDRESILEKLPCPFLADLSDIDVASRLDTLRLIKIRHFPKDGLAILPLGSASLEKSKLMAIQLSKVFNQNINVCHSILEAESFRQLLIIAESGLVTKRDLAAVSSHLKLQNQLNAGWVWIENNSTFM